ncbi:Crp/Fnr family transcriptional regulator [Bergeyella zoohelcum]|uniref:Fumarate and nitrate reduction regulatory protein n=1 Tax=Bergeyella zoohelcum TaxID=1015 RepID=A0A376C0H2_9FLAO|nr:Crp/Fnr family transcriptional regulator [Bergeyella zoohelcum]EKB57684.1 hypothetical protein HMPREF9700_02209 [Bergeyella zoohelcum CCUG 30536]SSZ55651.1 Fumarate and nitrate reduction regulatory protein [Bergeyella zoohelcum]
MKNLQFDDFLNDENNVEIEFTEVVHEHCATKIYKKGTLISTAGETFHNILFVKKGLLRQYYIDEKGKESILHFAPENWLISDRASSCFHQPSMYDIEALEDTTVMVITPEIIEKISEKNPEFATFNQNLLHRHIHTLQKRITMLQAFTAEQRYLDFIKTYPDILMRVPQSMVASYLGITPETLSRVRRELVTKHKNASS